jgi:glyoxylase-like metal-dependent hydrolase (beta-lactamase superfamily II)
MQPRVFTVFDKPTFTATHVIAEADSPHAAIVDSVLGFDPKSGRTSTKSADAVVALVKEKGLQVDWVLETHLHADHLSAAPYLKEKLGGRIGIGEHVVDVQATFKKIYNFERSFPTDGSQFDYLFKDGDIIRVGGLQIRVMYTPGHTPACVTYVAGDAAVVGDTLFSPDYGTARCDFPGGDARTLYRSIRRMFDLPPATRLFLCHDYAPGGRPFLWETTVAEQRAKNIHINDSVTEDAFVKMRTERDKTLDMPVLILPAIQVNMRGGRLPPAEDNGISYLKLPVNAL